MSDRKRQIPYNSTDMWKNQIDIITQRVSSFLRKVEWGDVWTRWGTLRRASFQSQNKWVTVWRAPAWEMKSVTLQDLSVVTGSSRTNHGHCFVTCKSIQSLPGSRLGRIQGVRSGRTATERETGHLRPALRGPSLRGRETERPADWGCAAESANLYFFYRSFYILS